MSFRAGVDHYEWCITDYKDVSAARHVNWKLKGNRKGDNMSVSIRNHVYCCCFQWEFPFPEISSFSLCTSEATNPCLRTGNLFPWKWMGCHKHRAMTSFQDRVQGEYRLLWPPTVNLIYLGRQCGRGRGLSWTESSLGLLGWEMKGCDDCSLRDGSSCERKAIGLLLSVP